ncbi:MAG: ABC transporter substrate-binding protein [Phycisphaerae bacterium]|nr:ABC transporter substrate-binding protein [Phycisphaerae bacterium]
MKKLLLTLICISMFITGCSKETEPQGSTEIKPVELALGYVKHDHHLALYVAAENAAEYTKTSNIELKTVKDKERYELSEAGTKIANVQISDVPGGAKMPIALKTGTIEFGFGGVAAILAAIDSGVPIKIVAPLHYKGDMFVMTPDSPVNNWQDFVDLVKKSDKPIRIGYKSPMAVAKVIFQQALELEGIKYGDADTDSVQVRLICTQGGGKLNVALQNEIIDGYVGNNPFPAIGMEKKILKVICDLETLPPGNFLNHPCCCLAATEEAIKNKPQAIAAMLALFIQANETINSDLDKSVAAATKWLGTSEAVEKISIPTSGYSMENTDQWNQTMKTWVDEMDNLGLFEGKLKGKSYENASKMSYDFSLLEQANNKLNNSTE